MPVEQIGGLHALPAETDSFDLVACLDVLEHVLEGDALAGIAEMLRVSRQRVLITVAWFRSDFGLPGTELHITRHPIEWWETRVAEILPAGWDARRLPTRRPRCGTIEMVFGGERGAS